MTIFDIALAILALSGAGVAAVLALVLIVGMVQGLTRRKRRRNDVQ